jgi:hypothetical protein
MSTEERGENRFAYASICPVNLNNNEFFPQASWYPRHRFSSTNNYETLAQLRATAGVATVEPRPLHPSYLKPTWIQR